MSKSTVVSFGHENCTHDKEITNGVFPYNMLHFILHGEGYFNGIKLCAGQGFVCRQNKRGTYFPNPENPWTYGWINIYDGEAFTEIANNILFSSKDTFEFDLDKPYSLSLKNMQSLKSLLNVDSDVDALESISMLSQSLYYNLMSLVVIDSHRNISHLKEHSSNGYVKAAINLMHQHYHRTNFNISTVAETLHISTGYLRTLFSQNVGMSPQEYLLKVRMEKATEYLTGTDYSIAIIAASVGYSDQHNFSKMYKKYYYLSPSWRRIVFKQGQRG